MLSISQFANDSDVVEFYANCCNVKDKNSMKAFLQGTPRSELYQLLLMIEVKSPLAPYGLKFYKH